MSAGKFMKQAAERDYSQWWQKPGTFPWMFQQEKPPLPKRVIGIKENYERCIRGQEPYWMPAYFAESNIIWPTPWRSTLCRRWTVTTGGASTGSWPRWPAA